MFAISESLAWTVIMSVLFVCGAYAIKCDRASDVELRKIAQERYHDSITVILKGK
jgi:hypothetical protein